MKRNYCLSLVLLALFGMSVPNLVKAADVTDTPSSQSTQQAKKITGKVIDTAGQPIIGASVLVKGQGTGAVTDINGNFSVEASVGNTLVVSFVGYKTENVIVTSANSYSIILKDDAQTLSEVIVTAMGIKKEKKALGYAVQDVKGDEISKVKQPNIVNSLNGKIAGVNITNQGGAPGSSSSIIIRGGTSLTGDNQPLFVIDGVPIDNSTSYGNTGIDGFGAMATSTSNRAMDINSDDVESISVLKGPAAAALYGLKAAAGAIVITTKKGAEGTANVNINTRLTLATVNRLPKMQYLYGQGDEGVMDANKATSWGPAVGNSPVYNNMENFFDTSFAYDVNASVSGGTKNSNYYISGQRLDQNGVVPTTGYEKNSFRFNGEQKLGILTVGLNGNYINSHTSKTLTGGGLWNTSSSGFFQTIVHWPITDDMRIYEIDGVKRRLLPDVDLKDDYDNPNWLVKNNPVTEKMNRIIGSAYANIQPFDWFNASYKMGIDHYNSQTKSITSPGSAMDTDWQEGAISVVDRDFTLLNSTLMLNFNKKLGDFEFGLMVGHSYEQTESNKNTQLGKKFITPGLYSLNNIENVNKTSNIYESKKRLISAFGEFRFAYKNIAYLNVTGRNDWSSTLIKENRSFFYPSISGSFVFTELLPNQNILKFGKLRASWAQVGKDASVYATSTVLDPPATTIGGGYKDSWTSGNYTLVPEITTSWEIGADLRFLDGRLGIDFTYYQMKSDKQILNEVRMTNTTGYILHNVNWGWVDNKGIEAVLSVTPIKTKDWEWNAQFNIAHNDGTVDGLPVELMYVTEVQTGCAKPASRNNGGKFFGLVGQHWKRNDNGELIIGEDGYPITSTDQTNDIGDREVDVQIGFNNDIKYKNWDLSFLLDCRIGGDIYNATEYEMVKAGTSKVTANRGAKKVFEGVMMDGSKNTKEVVLDQYYYTNIYAAEADHFVTRTNWLRLRSLSLSYTFPKTILNKINFVKDLQLSLMANNLFVITNYKGMDPEVSAGGAGVMGAGSSGIDFCGVPSTRSFSFGINVKF